ncbi:hypothetical protein AAVH_30023 [Aphelenchoides avenae]|nr:hypothetical protein AAVH_30023 [Aphelenchus avenae]
MSSVPSEVLEDILHPLDRWTLDDVQFTDGRFLHLIKERMSDVCLRQVNSAGFRPSKKKDNTDMTAYIRTDGRPQQKIAHTNAARVFSELIQALRSARVTRLTLEGLVFTPELAAIVLQTPIVAGALRLRDGSCAELTPAQLQELLLHFSPTAVNIRSCQLRACQLNDELIRGLRMNRMREIFFQNLVPVDGGNFAVTDDALVDFCLQEDVPIGQGGVVPEMLAMAANGSFTKDLFKRLVEASSVSTRTRPFRIIVETQRFAEEDLGDFSQHLSYRDRGEPWQWRIYNFSGEQHGTNAAMDTQILLDDGDDSLAMIRARRPNRFFWESDE